MLQVTPSAVEHIARVREIRNVQGEVPRLVGNGALVGLQFVERPARDDQRIESGASPIYVAANVANALEQSILDARIDPGWDDVDTTLVVRLQPGATFTPTSPR